MPRGPQWPVVRQGFSLLFFISSSDFSWSGAWRAGMFFFLSISKMMGRIRTRDSRDELSSLSLPAFQDDPLSRTTRARRDSGGGSQAWGRRDVRGEMGSEWDRVREGQDRCGGLGRLGQARRGYLTPILSGLVSQWMATTDEVFLQSLTSSAFRDLCSNTNIVPSVPLARSGW